MKLQVSTEKFTAMVEVDDKRVIVDAAPILGRFVGQPFENLERWAKKLPGNNIVDLGRH